MFASNASSVEIGGVELNAANPYYHNGVNGAPGIANSTKTGANAEFNATTGTLTLNGLNVSTGEEGIKTPHYATLTIVVNGENHVISTTTSKAALNGNDSSSFTIKGSGSLELKAAYGIWVWNNATIEGNANVDITSTIGGIYNNSSSGKITIKDNANVTIDSGEYGIGRDRYSSGNIEISGGTLMVKGNSAALKAAPVFDDESKYQITASTSKTGEPTTAYDAANISSYKYLKIESEPAVTEEVGIYLRTRLVNDDTPANVATDSNIQLTPAQLDELGLVSSDARNDGYSDSDEYGYWVSYGTFPSAKAATYNHVTQERGSEGVTAVTNEMASSTVTKKEYITFNGLDKVTWDTLSWSQNSSGPNTWHLNGEVRLCKISFSMMGGAGEGADRYAVYNTARSDGLITDWPADPTRSGYTFDGWYTDTTGGTEITEDYIFKSNKTIYAHWTKNLETSYKVTIYTGSGMTTNGNWNQEGVTGAITPVIFKAGNGYYFPENYTVNTVNGISVTRDSYTQVTVSGTPTANTNFSLPNATAKEKAETPNLAVMQPVDGRDKGSIETTAAYEIRKDGESGYTGCSEGTTSLEPGTHYIRVKATDTALASDDQEIVINQPAEYTITFDANGGYFNDGANKQLTFKSGQVITAPDKPSKSSSDKKYTYTFDGWYTAPGDGKLLNADDKASATMTYYAHWIETPKEYKITYETDGGTINGEYEKTYTYQTGTIYFPTDVTRDGYTFKGWSTTRGTGNLLDSWKVTDDNLDDLTFYSLWSAIRAEKPQVSIDPATLSINCGDTADITITAEADKRAKYKLTYEWYESTGGSDENAALIDGATGNVYTVPADKEAGTYYYFCKVKATRTDNSEFVIVKSDVATVNVTKKSTGHYKPTQKPEIVAGEGVKAELRINGTKATITVEEGYEITEVLVNGVSLGKVTEITGLKTGDKVEIKTEKKQTEPEINVKNNVKELKLVARSSKTANKNIRIKVASVTDQNGNNVDLEELKAKGYTVKYKFYRSANKSSEYAARITKEEAEYLNTEGKKDKKYYYKTKLLIYDNEGNLVAQTELKQCKYGMRHWTK